MGEIIKKYGKCGDGNTWAIELIKDGIEFLISSDKNLRVYHAESGNLIKDLGRIHDAVIKTIILSQDDQVLYTGSADGYLKSWKTEEMEVRKSGQIIHNSYVLRLCHLSM